MNEKFPQEARKIMDERFGQDTLLSLATTDPNIRYDIDFSGNWRLLKSKMDDFGGGEEDGSIGYRGSEGECGRIADNLKDFWGKRSRKWFRFVWSATSLIDEYLYFRLSSSQGKEGEQCFWESSSGYLFTGNRVYKDALFAYYPSTNPESYFDSLEKISELPVEKVFRGIIV